MAGEFDAWIGRVEEATDTVTLRQAGLLAATLDYDAGQRARIGLVPGGLLPPLWHWTAFLPDAPMSGIGPDGHPKRGGFLPPVPLERRMWAGGRLVFAGDPDLALRIGEEITRRSEILRVAEKTGGAGRMVFVTLRHDLGTARGTAVTEEQDIVYIAMPDRFTPPPAVAAPAQPLWAEPVPVDPVRLFRFSAVTFNGHRIHYDLDYAQQTEKYPGLVVHGPLQAILMMQAARARAGGAMPRRFGFRGMRPLFHFDRFAVLGWQEEDGQHRLCTALAGPDGAAGFGGPVCMQADIGW